MKKLLITLILACFIVTTLIPTTLVRANVPGLPVPGAMVNLSDAYEPAMIKGLMVHQDNPFLFDFMVDGGQADLDGQALKDESQKLIKYFLATLAIPDKDLWVNLSPYEQKRIVPEALGQTDMGRDLLAQDYLLKQITSSLIYPEKELGKKFWDRVYAKAQQLYGTNQVPLNTFNKVWITADKAEVYEHGQTVIVVNSHLKVMLEEDYLATHKAEASSQGKPSTAISSQIMRDIILPELEHEVNTGKNFAPLRQIFNSIILASWYKKNLKQALLNQVYADKSTVKGIDLNDPTIKEQIYEQYVRAYKKGVFNYIGTSKSKDESGVNTTTIPRKYFSGGLNPGKASDPEINPNRDEAMKVLASAKKPLFLVQAGVNIGDGKKRSLRLFDVLTDQEKGLLRMVHRSASYTGDSIMFFLNERHNGETIYTIEVHSTQGASGVGKSIIEIVLGSNLARAQAIVQQLERKMPFNINLEYKKDGTITNNTQDQILSIVKKAADQALVAVEDQANNYINGLVDGFRNNLKPDFKMLSPNDKARLDKAFDLRYFYLEHLEDLFVSEAIPKGYINRPQTIRALLDNLRRVFIFKGDNAQPESQVVSLSFNEIRADRSQGDQYEPQQINNSFNILGLLINRGYIDSLVLQDVFNQHDLDFIREHSLFADETVLGKISLFTSARFLLSELQTAGVIDSQNQLRSPRHSPKEAASRKPLHKDYAMVTLKDNGSNDYFTEDENGVRLYDHKTEGEATKIIKSLPKDVPQKMISSVYSFIPNKIMFYQYRINDVSYGAFEFVEIYGQPNMPRVVVVVREKGKSLDTEFVQFMLEKLNVYAPFNDSVQFLLGVRNAVKEFKNPKKEVPPNPDEALAVKGGIDLNTSNDALWSTRKEGNGVEIKVDEALLARVKREGINYLTPVILQIEPLPASRAFDLVGAPAIQH